MDFENFQSVLNKSRIRRDASDWHGILCGLLCAGFPVSPREWGRVVQEIDGETEVSTEELDVALEEICGQTRLELNDVALGFQPMLPDDNSSLDTRVLALSRWCEGFLYGLAVGGVNRQTALPGSAAETLEDLAEISRAGVSGAEPDAEDEYYFTELVEYLRVAVMLLNEELNPVVVEPGTYPIH
jgi:hypothetical protein